MFTMRFRLFVSAGEIQSMCSTRGTEPCRIMNVMEMGLDRPINKVCLCPLSAGDTYAGTDNNWCILSLPCYSRALK